MNNIPLRSSYFEASQMTEEELLALARIKATNFLTFDSCKYLLFPKAGTPEYKTQSAMETLSFKVGLSVIMGGVLGFGLGIFMSPYSHSLATDATTGSLTTPQQMRVAWRQVKAHSMRSARNFAAFGAVYTGSEWFIERYRAKKDIFNSVMAGSLTGAYFALGGGPFSTMLGAVGMGFFSYGIEWYMHYRDKE